MEAVLPRFAYAVLVAELAGLTILETFHRPQPGGLLSTAIGWTGTASMIAMHVYSVRRRVRALSRWGRISRWLQLHIFLGIQGVLLVTFHSLHLATFGSLSGITFALTLVVFTSGMFGRYLFSFLPKGIAGERLSARQVEAELGELLPHLAAEAIPGGARPELQASLAALQTPIGARPPSLSLGALFADDRRARAALRSLDGLIASARTELRGDPGALARLSAAARRRVMLQRRLATLASAERIFRGWTTLHRPLTFILFGTVLLHVLGHYLYGAALRP